VLRLRYRAWQVAVPRVGRKTGSVDCGQSTHSTATQLASLPRRRSGASILAALADEEQRAWRVPAPPPPGFVLGTQEKERLALFMQFRGPPPRPLLHCQHALSNGCQHAQVSASTTVQEAGLVALRRSIAPRFAEAAAEVEERQAFVEQLQALGALRHDQLAAVRTELQDRVTEMQRLDERLRTLGITDTAASKHDDVDGVDSPQHMLSISS
jgi:hypothetical protein